ncbi:MAG TPA: arginine N-succinyltransferase [Kofleriaceae bacterium]|nr:arginine N-succinyltransferase [Kofleriaceae bacterium]
MFRIRQSRREDVDQILEVAEHLDTVNLPARRDHLERILELSQASFDATVAPADREYLFVLEDLEAKRVIGTSMILAQHGTRRAPHIFFRVENDERYSYTLDRYFVHRVLRIGYNYDGPTEIGGLTLLPSYRGNPEHLGKLLSYTRFLFMRMHRPLFRDHVLSELLPPLEPDGTSRLWEHVGRHFTGLTYQEADLLSKDNKEFIHALFPADPIHTELLPPEVAEVIGQVGPETRGVEKMLRRIGFTYAGQIDPFDGGPHFTARTDDVTLVAGAHEAGIAAIEEGAGELAQAIVGVTHPPPGPGFRAVGTRVQVRADGRVGLADDVRARLELAADEPVWMVLA